MSYSKLEFDVIKWGVDRGIIQNSTPLAQSRKTLEECVELIEACASENRDAMIDAYGDILVTLIIGCATSGLNLIECLDTAYSQIKDRKGFLRPDGVFVKAEAFRADKQMEIQG